MNIISYDDVLEEQAKGNSILKMSSVDDNPFVIQEHRTLNGTHWDLMLQLGNVLWTWRLAYLPSQTVEFHLPAERIHDHPLRFLSYEGPVQNSTGLVKIADSGEFKIIKQSDCDIVFEAAGKILTGRFQMHLEKDDNWLISRIS